MTSVHDTVDKMCVQVHVVYMSKMSMLTEIFLILQFLALKCMKLHHTE